MLQENRELQHHELEMRITWSFLGLFVSLQIKPYFLADLRVLFSLASGSLNKQLELVGSSAAQTFLRAHPKYVAVPAFPEVPEIL